MKVGPIETGWRSYAERTAPADCSDAVQTIARCAFWAGALRVIAVLRDDPEAAIESIASEMKALHKREGLADER